ncbi:MAG TPA: iron-containing alcohol dehydrogenase, partial [Vineibacter sp.]|nr:iron-containing alcohol dehydrogenase [Vineibacter sp.]
MQAGVYRYPDMDQVIFGRPCADVVAEEATRLGATRIFVIASGTLHRTTDVVSSLVQKLGNRHAATWDRIAAHTPRTDCVDAANAARDAKADLIVTVGGGSVTDAGKLVQLCLANDVSTPAQLDDYKRVTNATPPTRKPLKAPVVRQVAVPTTLSAGEFNAGAGCTDTATKKK